MIRKVCEKTTAIYGDHTTSKVEEPSYTTFNLRPRNASPSKPKKNSTSPDIITSTTAEFWLCLFKWLIESNVCGFQTTWPTSSTPCALFPLHNRNWLAPVVLVAFTGCWEILQEQSVLIHANYPMKAFNPLVGVWPHAANSRPIFSFTRISVPLEGFN